MTITGRIGLEKHCTRQSTGLKPVALLMFFVASLSQNRLQGRQYWCAEGKTVKSQELMRRRERQTGWPLQLLLLYSADLAFMFSHRCTCFLMSSCTCALFSHISHIVVVAGWHKLCNPSSRALRIFPIYEDFGGFLWSQRGKMRPARGGEGAVLSPQSSIFNPQSSVLRNAPKQCFCSQKLDLRHFSRECRENLNIRTLRIKLDGWIDGP